MPYDKVIFMSYAVPTFYPTPPGVVAPAGGAPTVTLADADLQARAQRLVNVLCWTQQQLASNRGMSDASTLKVFIAPEFYFRKGSASEVMSRDFSVTSLFGSYPETARYELAEALYTAIQGQAGFKDWLVVGGTICSSLPLAPSALRADLLNTAILLRGRRASMDASVPYMLMEKHYISNIDGPPQAWHANLNPTSVYSYRLNPDQVLDNIIRWDGMMQGVEVCLDHMLGIASDAMIRLSQVLGPEIPCLDLQMITSCGMDISAPHVAVKDGSLVLLTDGMSHADSGCPTPRSRLARYVRQGNLFSLLDAPLPALSVLPEGANYNVTYPGYQGQQGIYAFDQLVLAQP